MAADLPPALDSKNRYPPLDAQANHYHPSTEVELDPPLPLSSNNELYRRNMRSNLTAPWMTSHTMTHSKGLTFSI